MQVFALAPNGKNLFLGHAVENAMFSEGTDTTPGMSITTGAGNFIGVAQVPQNETASEFKVDGIWPQTDPHSKYRQYYAFEPEDWEDYSGGFISDIKIGEQSLARNTSFGSNADSNRENATATMKAVAEYYKTAQLGLRFAPREIAEVSLANASGTQVFGTAAEQLIDLSGSEPKFNDTITITACNEDDLNDIDNRDAAEGRTLIVIWNEEVFEVDGYPNALTPVLSEPYVYGIDYAFEDDIYEVVFNLEYKDEDVRPLSDVLSPVSVTDLNIKTGINALTTNKGDPFIDVPGITLLTDDADPDYRAFTPEATDENKADIMSRSLGWYLNDPRMGVTRTSDGNIHIYAAPESKQTREAASQFIAQYTTSGTGSGNNRNVPHRAARATARHGPPGSSRNTQGGTGSGNTNGGNGGNGGDDDNDDDDGTPPPTPPPADANPQANNNRPIHHPLVRRVYEYLGERAQRGHFQIRTIRNDNNVAIFVSQDRRILAIALLNDDPLPLQDTYTLAGKHPGSGEYRLLEPTKILLPTPQFMHLDRDGFYNRNGRVFMNNKFDETRSQLAEDIMSLPRPDNDGERVLTAPIAYDRANEDEYVPVQGARLIIGFGLVDFTLGNVTADNEQDNEAQELHYSFPDPPDPNLPEQSGYFGLRETNW